MTLYTTSCILGIFFFFEKKQTKVLVFEGYRCILYMICAQRPHMWAHPTFIVMFKELVKILPKDGRPAATAKVIFHHQMLIK